MKGRIKEFGGKELLDRVLGNRLEENEESVVEPWLNSSFIAFYRCLRMPTEGIEREILLLLKKMKEMKELKDNLGGKTKKV